MATLADLQRRIEVVRRNERNVILWTGLSRTLVTLIAAVLGYFALDWIFELPYAGRIVALLLLLAGMVYTFYKHVTLQLRRILDDDEIALRVESRNPSLNGRLISTIQLQRAQKGGEFAGSPELIAALEEDTIRVADPLDFLQVINRESLKRFALAAVVIVVIKAVCLVRFPEHFQALAMRLVDPEQQYPTRTRIDEVKIFNEEGKEAAFVARGDAVKVRVYVDPASEVPVDPGRLVFVSDAEGTEIPADLEAEGGGVFVGRLSKAIEPMSVRAFVGDARSRPLAIRVLSRPEVEDGTVAYTLPDYTGAALPGDKFGGLTALQGSTAMIEIAVTKSLVEAKLERLDQRVYPFEKADAEGLRWRLKEPFLIDKSNSFHVALRDTDGLINSQPPVEYPVEAKPDAPPVVKISRPRKDTTVIPNAKPIVVFDVRDDFGVRATWLVFRIQRKDTTEPGPPQRFELPKPPEGADRRNLANATFAWDLTVLNLAIGDQLIFWLEADDDCPSNNEPPARRRRPGQEGEEAGAEEPDPNQPYYSHSIDLRFSVVSKEEKAQELQAEIARLIETLRNMKDQQDELKNKLRERIEELQQLQKALEAAP